MAGTDYAANTDYTADSYFVTRAAPVVPSRLDRALLAILRIGVGLLWLQNVGWKTPPDFGRGDPPGGLYLSASNAVSHEVFYPYAWLMDRYVLPNFTFCVQTSSCLIAFSSANRPACSRTNSARLW